MFRAAIIGNPVNHSKSPEIFEEWFSQRGITGEYVKIEATTETLQSTLIDLINKGYAGANITIPFKETVLQYVDTTSEQVQAIGATNCLVFKNNKIHAENTDIIGISSVLRGISNHQCALLIGAGGAAKAALYALKNINFKRIIVANRNRDNALGMIGSDSTIEVISLEEIIDILPAIDLAINSTSIGLNDSSSPIANLDSCKDSATILDLVYKDGGSTLYNMAKQRGLKTIDGYQALVEQAKPCANIWFGFRF